jgi:hypothetical protein
MGFDAAEKGKSHAVNVLRRQNGPTDFVFQGKIPGVGFGSIPILDSWIAAYRMTKDPLALMTAAYEKYKPGYFRIATLQGEYILVTDNDKVAEYLRAPDDVLSMQDAANDQQQIPFTMGWGIGYRTYHTPIVRTKLTSSIKGHVDLMTTEIRSALDDLVGAPQDDTPCIIYDTIAMVVARVSNRIMVSDEDLYRNKDFLRMAIDYAEAVVLSAELLKPFPEWMKHILVRVTPVWACRRKAKAHLEPLLRKRLAGGFEDGKRPDDLLQWLADAAPPVDRNIDQMVERLMAMNVASIHTTTMVSVCEAVNERDDLLMEFCRHSQLLFTSSQLRPRNTCPSCARSSITYFKKDL